MSGNRKRQRKQAALLLLLATGMFGFAFALVPLYNIFCELTGLNGKTSGQVAYSESNSQPSEREVTVEFLAHVGRGMPWEFRPMQKQMRVRLGEVNEARYYVRNFASQTVTGQAVPSVTPGLASRYLNKIECFCFTQQTLEAGEEMEMPVKFYMADDLPGEISTLTLSYALFPVPAAKSAGVIEDDDVTVGYGSNHQEAVGS
jgi:cytochrome c oxidase assembly protein subunit 11